jgi:SAM-dependent methyltransferase
MLQKQGMVNNVAAIDVLRREKTLIEIQLFDGDNIPYDDRYFDLSMAIDVVHHTEDPIRTLQEILRCTKEWLLLKDHTFRNLAGWGTLCLLDEIGNRRFGVPSVYHYQRQWEWLDIIQESGFHLERLVYPSLCHTGLLGWATNSLQFVGLWRRGQR